MIAVPERDPLIDFVSSVSGDEYLKVEEDLGDGFVRLRVSEAERRQAKHDIRGVEDVVVELLRNSRDAHARQIYVATSRDGDERRITVVDDGIGVPEELHERVFDPRVTSKLETMTTDRWGVHGRGMALFSIKSNVTTARIASSAVHRGSAIVIVSDLTELPERSDQSTWPVIEREEEGDVIVAKGPHNIVRRTLEFACDHPETDVYLGTPTEILATLHAKARDSLGTIDLAFRDDLSELPVWQKPAASPDAASLVMAADEIGIPVSERTAHRILAGEIGPMDTVLRSSLNEPETREQAVDIYRDRRGIKVHDADLDEFRRDLHEAFDRLGEKYYLMLRGEPRVHVGKDEIRVRFTVDKED